MLKAKKKKKTKKSFYKSPSGAYWSRSSANYPSPPKKVVNGYSTLKAAPVKLLSLEDKRKSETVSELEEKLAALENKKEQ